VRQTIPLFSPTYMCVFVSLSIEIEKITLLQYGAALALIAFVPGMNFLTIILRDRLQSRRVQRRNFVQELGQTT